MAYEDDRDMELDRQLYEEDPAYEADTYFGERLNEPINDGNTMEVEEFDEEEMESTGDFGEAINPDTMPAKDENQPAPHEPDRATTEEEDL